MSKGAATRNFAVGISFLGSLAILGAATLSLKGLPLLTAQTPLKVRFDRVDQLAAGDQVVYQGFRIGQVDHITLDHAGDPANPILVHCNLDAEASHGILPLDRATTTFSIRSSGPLGGRFLEIAPQAEPIEPPPPPPAAPDEYTGQASGDLFRQLEQLVEKNEGRIDEILEGLRDIVNDMRTRESLFGRVVRDEELGREFDETVRSFNRMAESFSKVGDAINNSEGMLGALINDPATRDKAINLIDNLSEVTDTLKGETGIIGFLLNNQKAKEDLQAAIADLREITDMVREGEGVVGKLLRDTDLADRLEDIIADVQDIVHKANSGHGTLGQIINNRKAWDELVRILVQARETIEDLREQAPVSTFVNALFAVF